MLELSYMGITEDILENDKYKHQIEALDNETLVTLLNDHDKALEYAQKAIEQIAPEKLDDVEYLEVVANGMRQLAKAILEERPRN